MHITYHFCEEMSADTIKGYRFMDTLHTELMDERAGAPSAGSAVPDQPCQISHRPGLKLKRKF